MKRTKCWRLVTLALVAVGLCQTAAAQSTSRIYDMMRSQNESLWRAQDSLRQTEKRGAALASPGMTTSAPGVAAMPQFVLPATLWPITATDFQPQFGRILPDRLTASMTGVTLRQKLAVRTAYIDILTTFERERRRNNIASAVAWAVAVSLEIELGRELSEMEYERLTKYFNQSLAMAPQFNSMAPQQKQILYESLIISGGTAGLLYSQATQQNDASLQLQANQLARTILQQWPVM